MPVSGSYIPLTAHALAQAGPFSDAEREAVYRAIHTRRDVRN